jgi:hypothetical protein
MATTECAKVPNAAVPKFDAATFDFQTVLRTEFTTEDPATRLTRSTAADKQLLNPREACNVPTARPTRSAASEKPRFNPSDVRSFSAVGPTRLTDADKPLFNPRDSFTVWPTEPAGTVRTRWSVINESMESAGSINTPLSSSFIQKTESSSGGAIFSVSA